MFDAQRLKIKTVIVNSSGHMHVTRAYFYIFSPQPAKEESSQVLFQREITDCDLHVFTILWSHPSTLSWEFPSFYVK